MFDQTVRSFSASPKVISFCVTLLRSRKPDHGPQGVECRGRFVQGILKKDFDGSSSATHRWLPAQRAPTQGGRPQQKMRVPLVQQPKKGPTTVEKLTKELSALDGSSPEAQVLRESLEKAKAWAISPEPIRVSPDEVRSAALAKIARLEAAITALGPNDSPRKSVLEEALQKVKKEAKLTPVGERLDSCLQFIEIASKRLQLCEVDLAQVLQKKSRLEDELAQALQN